MGLRLREVALLLGRDCNRWRGDRRIRELAAGLLALSGVAVAADTALAGAPPDLDHAVLAPVRAPGVLDQPVVDAALGSVADDKDRVICLLGGAF